MKYPWAHVRLPLSAKQRLSLRIGRSLHVLAEAAGQPDPVLRHSRTSCARCPLAARDVRDRRYQAYAMEWRLYGSTAEYQEAPLRLVTIARRGKDPQVRLLVLKPRLHDRPHHRSARAASGLSSDVFAQGRHAPVAPCHREDARAART